MRSEPRTRHILWQVLLIVAGIGLVATLLGYVAVNYTTVIVPASGGSYIEAVAGYPRYLNPLLSFNDAERDVAALLFSGLTHLNERGEVEPDLATHWEITENGLSYKFALRTDAYWHDGTPVTADDVLLTVRLLQDPDYPGPQDVSALWQTVTVEKVDQHTVRFVLPEPYAPFLDYTTVGLLPAHLLGDLGAADLLVSQFNLNPVGTGRFKLLELGIDAGVVSYVTLEPAPDYYGAQPKLSRVRLQFYPTTAAAFNAYLADEVEGVCRVTASDLPRARATDLNLFSAPISELGMVLMNFADADRLPFFQDGEVRQALIYGLDRQQLIDVALDGQAVVASGPFVQGTWAYDARLQTVGDAAPTPAAESAGLSVGEDLLQTPTPSGTPVASSLLYTFNPERARALLDGAGWVLPASAAPDVVRQKDGRSLEFTLVASNVPPYDALAAEVARQWAEIGVQVHVELVSPLDLRSALGARQFDAILVQFLVPGDPDPYPFWHETQAEGGQNYAGLTDVRYRRLYEVIERARITVNKEGAEGRMALYDEFQEIFMREALAVPLYQPVYTYGVSPRILGVQLGPLVTPSDRLRSIADWYVVQRRVIASEE